MMVLTYSRNGQPHGFCGNRIPLGSGFMAALRQKESYAKRQALSVKFHVAYFLTLPITQSHISFFKGFCSFYFLDFSYAIPMPPAPSSIFLSYLLNFKVHFTLCGLQLLFHNGCILLKVDGEKVLRDLQWQGATT